MSANTTEQEALDAALERYIYLFNHLKQECQSLERYVSEDIYFQDPFNKISGVGDMKAALNKFAEAVSMPQFNVTQRVWAGTRCYIHWDFSGHLSLIGDWRFPGVSELHFDGDGKVFRHIDHWDAGEHFYQHLPVIGWVIKIIRRRI